MPTRRKNPAVATAHSHLVVAGGHSKFYSGRDAVEVLNVNTLQWFTAHNLPVAAMRHEMTAYPQVALCGGNLYFSEAETIFSCSVKDLLNSCEPTPTNINCGGSVWTRLTNIPAGYDASLVSISGHVLALGGCYGDFGEHPTAAIHCYDVATNSWKVLGQLPTLLWGAVTAVLPTYEVIVAGGSDDQERSYNTYITNMQ